MPETGSETTTATVMRGLGPGFAPRRKTAVRRLIDCLLRWQERAVQRYRLAEMSDRQLRDLGLTRGQVDRESRKPFWQL